MNRIREHLVEARESLEAFLSDSKNLNNIALAIKLLSNCFKNGGKVISCGNGGSMCDAMHFAEELSGKFREERKALPALAISDPGYISCVSNDFGYDHIFSRQLEALGKPGDVLLAISTSGNSENIIQAAKKARELGISVIGLTGKDGGKLSELSDIEIRAPKSNYADRAQEIHIKVIHIMIDGIESTIKKMKNP